ncbi:MAG: hypothetical protein LBM08_06175 [Dysgonamonadaceae bacterium]|nr:hypothetical protein [Dysgonamonadaceae bacterium]
MHEHEQWLVVSVACKEDDVRVDADEEQCRQKDGGWHDVPETFVEEPERRHNEDDGQEFEQD